MERGKQIPSSVQEALSVNNGLSVDQVARMFTGPTVRIRVGNSLPDIEVEADETVIGCNGIIHIPEEQKDWGAEDPKFNGFGGRHPNIDR